MFNFAEIAAWAAGQVNLPANQVTIGAQYPKTESTPHVMVVIGEITPEGDAEGGQVGTNLYEYQWRVSVILRCVAQCGAGVANPYAVIQGTLNEAVTAMRRNVGGAPEGVVDIVLAHINDVEVGGAESMNNLAVDAIVSFAVREVTSWGWVETNIDGVSGITAEVGMHSGTGQLTGNSPLGLRSDFGLTSYRGSFSQIDPDGVLGNSGEETYTLLADTKGTQGEGRLIYLIAEMQQGGSVVRHGHGGIDPGFIAGYGISNMPIPDENFAAFIATDPANLPADQWRLLYYPAVRNWHGLTPRSWFAKRTGNDVVCYAPDLYQDGQYLTPRLVKATATIPVGAR